MPPEAVPSNASIASTGFGIRYIGNWVYAYSGSFGASTTTTTRLDFHSGAGVIIGKWFFSGNVNITHPSDDEPGIATLFFNGELIAHQRYVSTKFGTTGPVPIIIPPHTHVEVKSDATDNIASRVATTSITGRVYE